MYVRRPVTARAAVTSQRRHRPDYWLLMLALALLSVGLVVIYSISPGLSAVENKSDTYYVNKQLLSVGLGLVAFVVLSNLPLKLWRKATLPFAFVAIATSLIVTVQSLVTREPTRWINLGNFSFQPAEVVKLAVILVLALFLLQQHQQGVLSSNSKTLKPFLIGLAAIGAITVIIERDLGSMAVIACVMLAMLFVSGFPMRRIVLVAVIIAAAGLLAIVSTPYRRDRLMTFLHPERDCLNAGYQACQALIAVGSGGVLGLGLGNSVQAYGYLPEAANDSIFAILAEKFGFLGVVGLLVLLGTFFTRLKRIMERTPDLYTRLLITGVFVWLASQSIINIGAMLGLLPLKGITLPFISYGGTSVVFVMAALGLAYQVSRYTTFAPNETLTEETRGNDNSRNGGRFSRSHYTTARGSIRN